MNGTMDGLKAAWPQVSRFIKEFEREGFDTATLKSAVNMGLTSVDSGGYTDPRQITADKIFRFRETVMAICFASRPSDLAAFRSRAP